ncbi:actin-5c-related [Anaeramoeba flamelloides]|uniref:Actin-5c-related n=1 Tax=Anaeramoeba flamelloides TaxID=1746091 RepID=A0ABQ8ZBI1_9EUKA|nr:actin-5c-related [Anaeramoeba flamelloides]
MTNYEPIEQPILIDLGSDTCKVGFCGANECTAIPSIQGESLYENMSPVNKLPTRYVSLEATNLLGVLKISSVIEDDKVNDWEGLERLYSFIFENQLKITNINEHSLVQPLSRHISQSDFEVLNEILFEKFSIPALHFPDPLNCITNNYQTQTGVVVDCGYSNARICSTIGGVPNMGSEILLPYGGKHLNDHLKNMLTKRGYYFQKSTNRINIFDYIKKKGCFVSQNYETDFEQTETSCSLEVDLSICGFEMCCIGVERFDCPELLFQPKKYKYNTTPLPQSIVECINKSTKDKSLKEELYHNIILTGGSVNFPGFTKRLETQLDKLNNENYQIKVKSKKNPHLDVWYGASSLTHSNNFNSYWVTNEYYKENGVPSREKILTNFEDYQNSETRTEFQEKEKKEQSELNTDYLFKGSFDFIADYDENSLVIDFGSLYTKFLLASSNEEPNKILSCYGYLIEDKLENGDNFKPIFGKALTSNSDHEYRILRLIENGVIKNLKIFKLFLKHIFERELQVNAEDITVIVTMPCQQPKNFFEQISDILFNDLNIANLKFVAQPFLTLLNYNSITGVVLDIGDEITQCVPFYKGYVIKNAIRKIKLGGNDINQNMENMFVKNGTKFKSFFERVIVLNDVKENLCYFPEDFYEERYILEVGGKGKTIDLLNGKTINLPILVPIASEALMEPMSVCKDIEKIDDLCFNVIMDCDISIRNELANNIIITGGTCALKDYETSFKTKISQLLPAKTTVRIIKNENVQFNSILGGLKFITHKNFKLNLISKKEFIKNPSLIYQKSILF